MVSHGITSKKTGNFYSCLNVIPRSHRALKHCRFSVWSLHDDCVNISLFSSPSAVCYVRCITLGSWNINKPRHYSTFVTATATGQKTHFVKKLNTCVNFVHNLFARLHDCHSLSPLLSVPHFSPFLSLWTNSARCCNASPHAQLPSWNRFHYRFSNQSFRGKKG